MTPDAPDDEAIADAAPAEALVELALEGVGYTVRIQGEAGPLDLLLQLIRKEELDIFDIQISRLTSAYLDTLEAMRRASVEPASEFLVMAATLLQIKSRLLLPRPPSLDDMDLDAEDPRADLVRQLLEYQRFREVAVALGGRTRLGWDCFDRPSGQDRPPADDDEDIAAHNVMRLIDAFRALVQRGGYTAPHDIYVERVTIGERIAEIADRLAAQGRTTFQALCGAARHREEIITTFLALLEMARLKLITVTQGDRLDPVYVEARVGAIGELGERAAGMLDEG